MKLTTNDDADGLRGGNLVYQDMLRRILDGDLPAGSRSPIEHELEEQ